MHNAPMRTTVTLDDYLVLYTDGLVETRAGGIDERIDRVGELARRWSGPLDGLPAALVAGLCPEGASDDVAILVARVGSGGPVATAETRIESQASGVVAARCFTAETFDRWSAPSVPGDLELLVSELVTNAVVHGSPPIRLRLTRLGDEVLIEVDDGSLDSPHRRHPGQDEEHGRGLHILNRLARRWGVSRRPDGKTVWCAVAVSPVTAAVVE